ncbi:MAG: hypothetical protein PWP64_137 [Candidatus Cloacimonadota bacterium]|nr:hypothetical protein [Candidatus Cloacimonadota bacterium]
MLKVKNPSPKKLNSILQKNPLTDATILHYTGNMWGIGARVSAHAAIQRINANKQRGNPGMIVLVPDILWFNEDNIKVPERVYALMQQYFPGNLSIAFKVDDSRFEHVAVDGKVAFRVPTDPLLRLFIELLDEPIVSTSVNYSQLPAENDVGRLERVFASWFDFALYPHPKAIQPGAVASTLVEYIEATDSGEEAIKCLREGSVPYYEIKRSFYKPLIMFVCTANICRSPIAEKLFRKMIQEHNLSLSCDSCGLLEGGHMMSLPALQLLMENGITEAQEHVSKQITQQMVAASWLVLTMEERQRNFLREANPDSRHKILTLNEITGYEGDIDDPYESDIEVYQKTYQIIEERLQILLDKIMNKKISLVKGR